MGKAGGPCQGPGRNGEPICGETEVPDTCDWRYGKEEHAGKACCTRKGCREHLKVIKPKDSLEPAAAADPPPPAEPGTTMFLDPEHQRQLHDADSLGPHGLKVGRRLIDHGIKWGMERARREERREDEQQQKKLEQQQKKLEDYEQRAKDDAAVIEMLQKHMRNASTLFMKAHCELLPRCDELYEPHPSQKRLPDEQTKDLYVAKVLRGMQEEQELCFKIAWESNEKLRERARGAGA